MGAMVRREGKFEDRFEGSTLDPSQWFPRYLPAWSLRTATRTSYRCGADGPTLDIPADHPIRCPGDHTPRCGSPASGPR